MADFRLTQTGEQVQSLLNQIPTVAAEVLAKYTKPVNGIPDSDLTEAIQQALLLAVSAYQKPSGGIPATDLTTAAQNLLTAAGTAYQKPGTGIPSTDLATAVQNLLTLAGSAYQKPASGIPLTDLAASVQAAINAAAGQQEAITALQGSLTNHVGNSDIHVTLQDKAAWNAKQTQAQVEAIVLSALTNYATKSQVSSDIAAALADYSTTQQVATAITNALAAYYTKTAIDTIVAGLQTKLTFDQTPTLNSANPVTSEGIRAAIANAVNGLVNSTYVQNAITTALANYSTTAQISAMITTALTTTLANYYTKAETDTKIQSIVGTIQAQAAGAAASAEAAEEKADDAAASAAAANQKLVDLETYLGSLDPESAASVAAALGLLTEEVHTNYAKKNGYYEDMTVGNAKNIESEDVVTEQTTLGVTAPDSEIGNGSARMQTIEGDGISWSQLYDKMAGGASVASEQAQLEFLFGKVVERFTNYAVLRRCRACS